MTVRYTITHWDSPTAMKARSFTVRYRAPAAQTALYAAIYDMLDAVALRDRPVALRLVAEFEACDVSPPPPGSYRSQVFWLDASHSALKDGAHVTFMAERI